MDNFISDLMGSEDYKKALRKEEVIGGNDLLYLQKLIYFYWFGFLLKEEEWKLLRKRLELSTVTKRKRIKTTESAK